MTVFKLIANIGSHTFDLYFTKREDLDQTLLNLFKTFPDHVVNVQTSNLGVSNHPHKFNAKTWDIVRK